MATAILRGYLSGPLLRTAWRCTERAREIERADSWEAVEREEHLDMTVSAVVSAALFVEAAANEIFTDAKDVAENSVKSVPLAGVERTAIDAMATWWSEIEANGSTANTLAKYQILLLCGGRDRLKRGSQPYQGAVRLLDLRNHLVHFKPMNVAIDSKPSASIESKLRGCFAPNPHNANSTSSWPVNLLSADCGRWATDSATALTDEVFSRLNISPSYQGVKLRRLA